MIPVSGCGAAIAELRCTACGRFTLLDSYSCAGGAGVGYHRAGLCVTGNDIVEQPRYPFHHIVGDAIDVLADIGWAYAARHASPPCQDSSTLTRGNRGREGWSDEHVDLIPDTRARLLEIGGPWVMENVQGSSLRRDLVLCGEMFGLGVIRHRYFELGGVFAMQPPHSRHRGKTFGWNHGVRHDGPYSQVYGSGGGKGSVEQWQTAMGIDWTADRVELAEAIPPAYTELIGAALLADMEAAA